MTLSLSELPAGQADPGSLVLRGSVDGYSSLYVQQKGAMTLVPPGQLKLIPAQGELFLIGQWGEGTPYELRQSGELRPGIWEIFRNPSERTWPSIRSSEPANETRFYGLFSRTPTDR